MATTDERNFRSAYYEKVGFRSVEEKKSLEILLKDKPLEKLKLKQFCLRFSVPVTYRKLLWKLILGIVPVHMDSHEFVMLQRQQEYDDLLHALRVMRLIEPNATKCQTFLAIWLLHTDQMKFDSIIIQQQTEHGFMAITQSLLQLFDTDIDVYWMAKSIYGIVEQFKPDLPKLIERTIQLLEKEDHLLHQHFEQTNLFYTLPMAQWFDCCFAGIIPDMFLVKIWDKLCGGSYKILVFVILAMLMTLRTKLFKCTDLQAILMCIDTMTEESAETIMNKAFELWQQHGSSLTMSDTTPKIKTN